MEVNRQKSNEIYKDLMVLINMLSASYDMVDRFCRNNDDENLQQWFNSINYYSNDIKNTMENNEGLMTKEDKNIVIGHIRQVLAKKKKVEFLFEGMTYDEDY